VGPARGGPSRTPTTFLSRARARARGRPLRTPTSVSDRLALLGEHHGECAVTGRSQLGGSHGDHQERPRDSVRAGRVVHGLGLHRPVATPSGPSRLSASSVHFTPGARTAWHTHPLGQTIYVLEGLGRAQRRGGPVEVIRPGDRVFFEPGEEHWHGAAPDRLMTHLAMLEVDDEGNNATWRMSAEI